MVYDQHVNGKLQEGNKAQLKTVTALSKLIPQDPYSFVSSRERNHTTAIGLNIYSGANTKYN
jgi:hypothetical protein